MWIIGLFFEFYWCDRGKPSDARRSANDIRSPDWSNFSWWNLVDYGPWSNKSSRRRPQSGFVREFPAGSRLHCLFQKCAFFNTKLERRDELLWLRNKKRIWTVWLQEHFAEDKENANFPGEFILANSGPIELDANRRKDVLLVKSHCDRWRNNEEYVCKYLDDFLKYVYRPIQIGSHYHFIEANRALQFDRARSCGMRLDIPAGTAIRFEPGGDRAKGSFDRDLSDQKLHLIHVPCKFFPLFSPVFSVLQLLFGLFPG